MSGRNHHGMKNPLTLLRQQFIQLIGKRFAVILAQGGQTAGIDAAGAQVFHEIPHAQARTNVFPGIQFAARTQHEAFFFDDLRRQRYIAGNHEIAAFQPLDDFIVGHIESGFDLLHADKGRWWNIQGMIGDQYQMPFRSFRRAEENFFDHTGASIRINPYFHSLPLGLGIFIQSSFSSAHARKRLDLQITEQKNRIIIYINTLMPVLWQNGLYRDHL